MKKNKIFKISALPMVFAAFFAHAEIKEDAPNFYIVQKGDTLWDLSSMYLDDPWKWPELWDRNPQIEDAHWIYPGDVILVKMVDGEKKLFIKDKPEMVKKVKLEPTEQLPEATEPEIINPKKVKLSPTIEIELAAIDGIYLDPKYDHILSGYVFNDKDKYSRVLGERSGRIAFGAGDTVYISRDLDFEIGDHISVFEPLQDANIGVRTENSKFSEFRTEVMSGVVVDSIDDVHLVKLKSGSKDVRKGYIVTNKVKESDLNFVPHYPYDTDLKDFVIERNLGDYKQSGKQDLVLLSKGTSSGVEEGHVFDIITNEEVYLSENEKAPSEVVGRLIIFKTFEDASLAKILTSKEPIKNNSKLIRPRG